MDTLGFSKVSNSRSEKTIRNSCSVKTVRNSRAEKYLLLRSLVRTVAATRVSVQIRELKIGGRREKQIYEKITSARRY